MAKEIKLPFIGQVKSTYVWVGVAITAGIVGVAYWRRSHGSGSSSSPSSPSSVSGTASTTIDPQTGLPEGTPEDQAALMALSDPYGQNAAYGSAYGDGYGYGYGGIPGIPTTTSNPNSGPGTFTDNAYWLAYCEQNIIGYSPDQIQAALTAYLSGQKMTETQYTIYQTALAVGGPAPNPGPTPHNPGTGGGGGGGGGGGHHPISGEVQGLSAATASPTAIRVTWDRAEGATGYRVSVLDRGTTHVKESEVVKGTAATLSGLARDARYEIRVQAEPGKGHSTTYGQTGTGK